MKKLLLGAVLVLILTSCGSTAPKPLYYWGNYQSNTYNYVKNGTDESLDKLMESYEDIINRQTPNEKNAVDKKAGSRATIQPGVCADYGYLLCKQGKKKEGIALLPKIRSRFFCYFKANTVLI